MNKIMVSQLLNLKPVIEKLANSTMAAKDTFKVLRLLQQLDKEYALILQTWKNLIEKYALKDSQNQMVINNDNVVIDPNFKNSYEEEFSQLMNQEIEISETISEKALDSLEITPLQLKDLLPLIEQ